MWRLKRKGQKPNVEIERARKERKSSFGSKPRSRDSEKVEGGWGGEQGRIRDSIIRVLLGREVMQLDKKGRNTIGCRFKTRWAIHSHFSKKTVIRIEVKIFGIFDVRKN